MKSRDSRSKRGKKTGRRHTPRESAEWNAAANVVLEALRPVIGEEDHVDFAMLQWKHEMPEVDTSGADILNRARRVVLESRPAIEENFRRHGLDTGEFDVLATLRRAGEPYTLRPTELYKWLMVSSGGMTARLDKLEESGFIRRVPSFEDARSMLVQLTPAGKKKIEAAFRADMEIENRMVKGLSDKERADLIRLLRLLTASMKK